MYRQLEDSRGYLCVQPSGGTVLVTADSSDGDAPSPARVLPSEARELAAALLAAADEAERLTSPESTPATSGRRTDDSPA